MKAYLCLITWPNGTEGLLFPRPGNVPIADTEEKGKEDFEKAKADLLEYAKFRPDIAKNGTGIKLIEFERGKTLEEFTI